MYLSLVQEVTLATVESAKGSSSDLLSGEIWVCIELHSPVIIIIIIIRGFFDCISVAVQL